MITTANLIHVLTLSREYVAKGWCQKAAARDQTGLPLDSANARACYWCASGAVERAVKEFAPCSTLALGSGTAPDFQLADAARGLLREVISLLDGSRGGTRSYCPETLVSWNDSPERIQEEVLDLFDRAIKLLAGLPPERPWSGSAAFRNDIGRSASAEALALFDRTIRDLKAEEE